MTEAGLDLRTEWGTLAGTVAWPDGAQPCTAVLLIAGSGPTDRDGNNPLLPSPVDSLKRLAQALAGRGIASLRYDKRGVGASNCPGLSEEALRFEDLVGDAVLAARWLAEQPRVERLVLLGHSEGALIAMLAAEEAQAAGVVSLAGAGERASGVMRRQIQGHLPPDIGGPALSILDALEAQQAVEEVPEALVLLFRPSVQPYLMSWFRHDPAQIVAALAQPVLLVQGAADPQVGVEHVQALHAARPDARLRIVAGMDHVLAAEGSVERGAQEVAAEVAQWVNDAGVASPTRPTDSTFPSA